MGFRNPITTATAVDTRAGTAAPGVRMYEMAQPWGSQGVVEFDDGIDGDNPSQLVSAPNYQQQGNGYAPRGGSYSMKSGSFNGTPGPEFDLNVEPAPTGGYQSVARLDSPLVVTGRLTVATLTPAAGWTVAAGRGLAVVADGADYALDGLIQNTSAFTPNGTQVLLTVPIGCPPKANRFFLIPVYNTAQVVLCHLTTAGQLRADISTGQIPANSYWDLSRVVWDPASTN